MPTLQLVRSGLLVLVDLKRMKKNGKSGVAESVKVDEKNKKTKTKKKVWS